MPNTPKAVRTIKPHIANPMYCAICLKFAVAVISSLFLIRVLEKVGIRECKVFREKYYPQGWRFFPKTGGLTLHSRPIPELPLRPERK